MTVTRSLAAFSLLAAAACASSPQRGPSPRPARGDNGPGATISASYTGGIIAREVTASFNVSRPSFTVVGHLGGDGVLRVLYPSIPNRFAVTQPARRGYRTQPFFAGYDGAPSLHLFTMSPYRSAGARFESYDGRGYGYVFIIASQSPMRLESFTDGFDWVDLDVQDYFRTSDPRVAVRAFAEALNGRNAYTLKFARSFSTQNFSGYAANAFDCSVLSTLGHLYHYRFWNSWGLFGPRVSAFDDLSPRNIYPYASYFSSGCAPRQYASYSYYRYALGPGFNPYTPYTPRVGTPPTAGPGTPPVLGRPTERRFGQRAANVARSELGRNPNGARNARDAHVVRTRNGSGSYDNGSRSQISRRDLNRGVQDPPSTWSAGRGSDRTRSVNTGSSGASSRGGGNVTRAPSTAAPAPKPARTTAVPARQGATTKVKQ